MEINKVRCMERYEEIYTFYFDDYYFNSHNFNQQMYIIVILYICVFIHIFIFLNLHRNISV